MDNIIVYVDDARYGLQILQPMLQTSVSGQPARWIVVACAPRMTRRVSKWLRPSARASWRADWAEQLFSQLRPALARHGDLVCTEIAGPRLCTQTQDLLRQFGSARVLDARRPKFGLDMQPVTSTQSQEPRGAIGYVAALAGAGWLVAID
jgi:hypothetical protein